MELYKLKAEAAQYFLDTLSDQYGDLKFWNEQGISGLALEEYKPINISIGHEGLDTNLIGYYEKGIGTRFNFALNFPKEKKTISNFDKAQLIDKMERAAIELFNK
jgi:hypothetical protein